MKYLTLVLVLFIAACSNDTKMPTEIDHKTDFSAHVVSENGLKTHGCVFQGNAVVGFELVCDEKKTHLELYQQRVAIIQYERDGLNWILNPNVIETPSGQLMNKTSLDAVFEKHKSVHNLIHVPKGIEGNSWLAK